MGGMKEADLTESSKKKIIFATFSQAHEGLDIPTLDTVILATPKSDIVQSIGRIMRETHGKKNNPHIYDIFDQWSICHACIKNVSRYTNKVGLKYLYTIPKNKLRQHSKGCLFHKHLNFNHTYL